MRIYIRESCITFTFRSIIDFRSVKTPVSLSRNQRTHIQIHKPFARRKPKAHTISYCVVLDIRYGRWVLEFEIRKIHFFISKGLSNSFLKTPVLNLLSISKWRENFSNYSATYRNDKKSRPNDGHFPTIVVSRLYTLDANVLGYVLMCRDDVFV